jgi:hypothetical protein
MRKKYLNDPTLFLYFCDYPPFEEDLDLQLKKTWIPTMQDMFAPSLIAIGLLVLEKIFFSI